MRAFIFLSIIAIALADQECGENAHFERCGTACPLTCENYENPPKFCILRCDIGCHCDEGYVKTSDGQCVRPEQCPIFSSAPEPNCYDMPKTGRCLAYIPSWYYDARDQKCKEFIYGGCGGNGNRYPSEAACLKNCEGIVVLNTTSKSFCDLPAETGFCKGAFPRYHFDRASGKCQEFIYSGCGGNKNNFRQEEVCQRVCGKIDPSACLMEKAVGMCRASFHRYFFNKDTGECEEFIYGGCMGNSNNFLNKQECEDVCKS